MRLGDFVYRHLMSTLRVEHRRNIADIVFLQQIVSGKIDIPQLLDKIQLAVPRDARGTAV